jgi:hypothetical protein
LRQASLNLNRTDKKEKKSKNQKQTTSSIIEFGYFFFVIDECSSIVADKDGRVHSRHGRRRTGAVAAIAEHRIVNCINVINININIDINVVIASKSQRRRVDSPRALGRRRSGRHQFERKFRFCFR